MYLIPIQVPIYVDGDRRFVTTEWKRELELLRDSLHGAFGRFTVFAPSLPPRAGAEQTLEEIDGDHDGITLIPSIHARMRFREFLASGRRRWIAQLRELLPDVRVMHAGLDDLYKPLAWSGFVEGVRAGKPAIFVQDTDIALQQRELGQSRGLVGGAKSAVYAWRYEQLCRRGARLADLALLKGSRLMSRYGRFARNAKEFHETSYRAAEIASSEAVAQRVASLNSRTVRRFVYCGRLIARKGLDHSLRIVAAAVKMGADITYDLIGNGEERRPLQQLASSLGLGNRVTFHAATAYGPRFLARLANYDGLLFTPLAEDTPRMIFDGYAGGLPLIAYDIDYVKERATEMATQMLPRDQIEASARILAGISIEDLAKLSAAALSAAQYHAAENWYRRRAEWTFEAVDRHESANRTVVTVQPSPLGA